MAYKTSSLRYWGKHAKELNILHYDASFVCKIASSHSLLIDIWFREVFVVGLQVKPFEIYDPRYEVHWSMQITGGFDPTPLSPRFEVLRMQFWESEKCILMT